LLEVERYEKISNMGVIDKFPAELLLFFRYSAIAGFLATVTLIINFNHTKFANIFGDRSKSLWWLFLIFSVIPLLLFLFIFNFVFGRFELRQYGDTVLAVFGMKGLNAN